MVSSFKWSYKEHPWWRAWMAQSQGTRPENRRCQKASADTWHALTGEPGPATATRMSQIPILYFLSFCTKICICFFSDPAFHMCSSWQMSWLKTAPNVFLSPCGDVGCLSLETCGIKLHMAFQGLSELCSEGRVNEPWVRQGWTCCWDGPWAWSVELPCEVTKAHSSSSDARSPSIHLWFWLPHLWRLRWLVVMPSCWALGSHSFQNISLLLRFHE